MTKYKFEAKCLKCGSDLPEIKHRACYNGGSGDTNYCHSVRGHFSLLEAALAEIQTLNTSIDHYASCDYHDELLAKDRGWDSESSIEPTVWMAKEIDRLKEENKDLNDRLYWCNENLKFANDPYC